MHDSALVQRGAQGAVQAVFQIELAPPANDVREKVAVERGVVRQNHLEVQHVLSGDQLIQPDRARRDMRPFAGAPRMVGIGPSLPDLLEDHMASLDELGHRREDLGPVGRYMAGQPGSTSARKIE